MIFLLTFLFIFFQACYPTEIANASNPETKDYWIRFLLRREEEKITTTELEAETGVEFETESSTQRPFSENLNPRELEWTLLIGTSGASTYGEGIAVDNNGFIYVAGDTDKGVYKAEPIGNRDLILGKYDSRKNTIWTKQVGAPKIRLEVKDFAVDSNRNVYVTGDTKDSFASPLSGERDLFLIKFNSDGSQAWAKQTGCVGKDYSTNVKKIAVDTFGNSYIIGNSTGPFGRSAIGPNGFIIKFDTNGNRIWVKQISVNGAHALIYLGGITIDEVRDIIYVTGSGRANFSTNSVPGIGFLDLFIFKYDSSGNRQFFAQLGSASSTTEGSSINVDPSGNVFVGGTSNGNFESETENKSNFRGLLVKYDSSGTRQWVQQFDPIDNRRKQTVITAITTDANGNIFTTGYSSENITNETNTSIGRNDLFLTKFNSSGQIEWTQQIGTSQSSIFSTGIGLDSQGNLYCSGYTSQSMNQIPRKGVYDLFLLKFK
ncbi:SBBP repeat beta-propeller lipoprotein, LipL53 family [Leptospira borgpetersenii]|uniref:SBBP repeat beta-propeller lipoprotein, LipL53 family n=1 Tax=Leptospira borgpetersenii TaxID=174 RepID=UPI002159396B|nr:SBBP repeat-containing protein [Leptospira borgpetersenii]UVD72583.1 SBBP repeat-containing protein [Leptospira borgpetersenii]UVD75775.1 SBBP repeat-containing protein [Leptospira borgpetersenii]UZW32334.1 SBBP repeat-containing protein [Leptospira borgpetersenii]